MAKKDSKKKSNKPIVLSLIGILCIGVLIIVMSTISFSADVEEDKVLISSVTPVYDNNSGVVVNGENITFNDKDQSVEYKVVLENQFDYDIKVTEIKLATPSQEFLKYEVKNVAVDDVVKANSTKEVIVSLSTVAVEGWGRNFKDNLVTTVNFEKVEKNEEPNPPVDEDKDEEEEVIPPVQEPVEPPVEDTEGEGNTGNLPEESQNAVNPPLTDSEDNLKVVIDLVVEYVSPNVMIASECEFNDDNDVFYNCTSYWQYTEKFKSFTIENELREITEYAHKFDVSKQQNGSVVVYLVTNASDSNYYDAYLMADGVIYPNEDASEYFGFMTNIDGINNLKGIDTSNVTDMSRMFYKTGYNSTTFTLDVSKFDTSNVTSMQGMFAYSGNNSLVYELDVSGFDTRNVTSMRSMFFHVAYSSPNFTLDVSGFDTSKVTTMQGMFSSAGYSSTVLQLDVSGFDTSKVENFICTFYRTGFSNPNFVLDVSGFDTSSVKTFDRMFYKTAYNNPNFVLDTSNFDTSEATDLKRMFYATGFNSTMLNTSITISTTSAVYNYMFEGVAMKPGAQLTVNYTEANSELVDKMIATKSANSNVVKGICVDCES